MRDLAIGFITITTFIKKIIMEAEGQNNAEFLGIDLANFPDRDFWADKFERTNNELRSMLSEQVMIL